MKGGGSGYAFERLALTVAISVAVALTLDTMAMPYWKMFLITACVAFPFASLLYYAQGVWRACYDAEKPMGDNA